MGRLFQEMNQDTTHVTERLGLGLSLLSLRERNSSVWETNGLKASISLQ